MEWLGRAELGDGGNGDYYLNTANGAVYNKASGSWSVIANITGPAGGSVATQTYSCGRLTAQNGVPVPTADQTAVSTLYFTPYNGNVLTVLNGSGVKVHDQFAQLSVSVPNTVATLYDVFAYDNGGTLALDTPVAWSSSGAGTSARASAISLVDGMWVKTSDNTRRLVGTFMTSGTGGQTTDSAQYRLVASALNPVLRVGSLSSSVAHSDAVSGWHAWNADMTLRCQFVQSVPSTAAVSVEGDMAGGNSAYVSDVRGFGDRRIPLML